MSEQGTIDALADAAISPIESGMLVGLGAGQTASRAIALLGERVKNGDLDIECVAASDATEALAVELGLTIVDFANVEELDVLIDGADEVDRNMGVLKGARGAITRERMLAWASRHRVYMVQSHKITDKLGTNAPLSIAVMAFGLASVRKAIRELGLNGVLRRTMNGDLFITDNANLVLDVTLDGDEDLSMLRMDLDGIPGVIEHGLFLDEADVILVDHDGERVERLERPAAT